MRKKICPFVRLGIYAVRSFDANEAFPPRIANDNLPVSGDVLQVTGEIYDT
jgi:hypothetical protein